MTCGTHLSNARDLGKAVEVGLAVSSQKLDGGLEHALFHTKRHSAMEVVIVSLAIELLDKKVARILPRPPSCSFVLELV